jgi:capsular polysaccharide transport system permease protein
MFAINRRRANAVDAEVNEISHAQVTSAVATGRGVQVLERLLGKPQFNPASPVHERPIDVTAEDDDQAKAKHWVMRAPLRHRVIAGSFVVVVALPVLLASLYMAFIAVDQYHSNASFAVRSIDAGGTSDIMGMFTQSAGGSTVSDSYILMDYVRSEKMVSEVDQKFDLQKLFSTRGLDFFYGMGRELPIEDKLAYWRSMIEVHYDNASGIIDVHVKAFEPNTAREIGDFVVAQSDRMVNNLSIKARSDVLRAAEKEVSDSEVRLAAARVALREYRDRSQEVDPIEGAKLAAQLIAGLERELTKLNADFATAKSQMNDDAPRMKVLTTRIESLKRQISYERQRLGAGVTSTSAAESASSLDVAGRIQEYEGLETEREFAERAYTSSLVALEKARLEANNRQRYLALFIEPTLSEMAQYPMRLLNVGLVAIGLLFAWGIAVMGYYNIRDRA